jgi:TrmH family RNA methyltransferase
VEITSKDNARLKNARAVRDGRENDLLFVEGLRVAEELTTSNLEITEYFFTTRFAQSERGANLLGKLAGVRAATLNENLLASISDTKMPQGIIVLAKRPKTGRTFLETTLKPVETPLLIVLHKLNNPVNVGAILRTAEAAGAAGAILTRGSADVFSPKSLRGAMGSAFRVPLWTNADFGEAIEFCRADKIKTVCAELNARKTHVEIDWTCATALIIGSEAEGLAYEEIAQTDESLAIPMRPPVESLNAAVACGIILYESVRQKAASNYLLK